MTNARFNIKVILQPAAEFKKKKQKNTMAFQDIYIFYVFIFVLIIWHPSRILILLVFFVMIWNFCFKSGV